MNELRMLLWAMSIAGASVLAFAPGVSGTPEMAQREGRNCVTCHTGVGRPELNEIGEYYRDNNCSLEGYPGELPPPEGEPAPDAPAPELCREREPERLRLNLIRS
jgi:hypothetical protein